VQVSAPARKQEKEGGLEPGDVVMVTLSITLSPQDSNSCARQCHTVSHHWCQRLMKLCVCRTACVCLLAVQATPLLGELLQRALSLVEGCPCTLSKGCPRCVQHLDCKNYNAVLSKQAAVLVLREALRQEGLLLQGQQGQGGQQEEQGQGQEGQQEQQQGQGQGGQQEQEQQGQGVQQQEQGQLGEGQQQQQQQEDEEEGRDGQQV